MSISIVLESGQVRGSVLHVAQVVFVVVGVLGHAVIGVGDGDEAVGVIVSILSDFAILVSDTISATAIIISELAGTRRRRGISDFCDPVHHVVGKGGLLIIGID